MGDFWETLDSSVSSLDVFKVANLPTWQESEANEAALRPTRHAFGSHGPRSQSSQRVSQRCFRKTQPGTQTPVRNAKTHPGCIHPSSKSDFRFEMRFPFGMTCFYPACENTFRNGICACEAFGMRRPIPKRIAQSKMAFPFRNAFSILDGPAAPSPPGRPTPFQNVSTYPKERHGARVLQEPLRGAVIEGIAAANGMPPQALRRRHCRVDPAPRPQKVATSATTSLPTQWHRCRRNGLRCR